MLKKVLIANRGEIACRAIKVCREMGIKTVAIYSTADKEALHVQLADETYCIGSPQAKKSYLDIPSIITVAVASGADAVYPGYGFLAENADFADACVNCGLVFVGPSGDAIRKMGDKAVARKTMQEAGVTIVPGTKNLIESEEEARQVAEKIGYPVLIKATAGGGGKGMRVVENKEELLKGLRQAAREAERSFGNKGVYLEKYLMGARHVEIQLLGDNFGNVVYLGERDCSTQRRHQKLLEEAPSPALDEDLRIKMGTAAVAAAKAVSYSGAGTVEFILDHDKNFYFMEMNTRIQVEHPVTEAITGLDLVKAQFIIAAGEKLPWQQEDIKLNGWAIECRINAEDSQNNFIPCPGKLEVYKIPQISGVRIDSAVFEGAAISPFYDSMIAKVIAWAPSRSEAIAVMQSALAEFSIVGIKNTVSLHQKLIGTDAFRQGIIDTNYLENHLEEILHQ